MNDRFLKQLKRGYDRSHTDQKNMTEWEEGKIGLSVLFMRICENNSIRNDISGIHLDDDGNAIEYENGWISNVFTEQQFTDWLKGMGYGV